MATPAQPQPASSELVVSILDLLLQPRPQVFVNFRGDELRNGFVSHVVKALKDVGINVFIDSSERRGVETFDYLLQRINNSKLALAIFSDRYTESDWCLNELVRMSERMREGKLVVIPIFYKISTYDVKNFQGRFGRGLWETVSNSRSDHEAQRWMDAVTSIAYQTGLTSEAHSNDSELVEEIVKASMGQLGHLSSANLHIVYQVTLEMIVGLVVTFFCSCYIPSAFTDVKFLTSPQWFVALMFSFIVRKTFYWFLS